MAISTSKSRKIYFAVAAVGVSLALMGGILFPVSQKIIHDVITVKMPLLNGTIGFEKWYDPPVIGYMKIHFFDLLNKDEALKGAKPVVIERGPYVYRLISPRDDITFHPNRTMSYRQPKAFIFEKELSGGSEYDKITTINMVLTTLASLYQNVFSHLGPAVTDVVKLLMELEKEYVYKEFTVFDIVWGYEDPLLSGVVGKILRKLGYNVPAKIGLFSTLNGTDDGVYNVFTGEGDISLENTIDRYKGKRYLNFWTTPYSNRVNGTDGTIFHPFIQKSDTLFYFNSQICRSIYAVYERETLFQGINLYRFVPPPELFANITENPDNIGFCTPNKKHCLGTGLLNVSGCYQGAPVIISLPHFYQAHPKYIHAITGMNPNKETHASHMDVEPNLGVAINEAIRLQINLYYRNYSGFRQMVNLKETFFPLMWFQGGATLTPAAARDLQQEFTFLFAMFNWICYSFISFGLVLALLTILVGYYRGVFSKDSKAEKQSLLPKDNDTSKTPINT